jgi:hypothetical protein
MSAQPSRIKSVHAQHTSVPNEFLTAPVSHESFRLYVVLLSYVRGNAAGGGEAFPAYDTLCKSARIKSYTTVAKCLRELESTGWLERRKRFGASTIYTLTSPTPGVVMREAAVLRGVESSPTPDVGQSYTPSQTNQTHLTRHTEPDPAEGEARRQQIDAPPSLKSQPPPTKKRSRVSGFGQSFEAHEDPRVGAYLNTLRPAGGITATNAELIMRRVAPENIAFWQSTLTKWGAAEWNRTNFAGMFEACDKAANAARLRAENQAANTQTVDAAANQEYLAALLARAREGGL